MRQNLLRKRLNEGKPTLGTHIHITWPGIIELIGLTGYFDYVEFLGEYVPYDLHWLDNFARITELYNMSSMFKVEKSIQNFHAQKAVRSGIQSILFTDVHNAEEARRCIKIVKTPKNDGLLGAAMTREVGYVYDSGSDNFVKAVNDIVVVLMIEKKEAVDNLEDILSVDGVDMIQFGPNDYSLSKGCSREEANKIGEEVIRKSIDMGVPARIEIASLEDADKYLNMGIRHFCFGWDVRILSNWFKNNGGILKEMLEKV
ncbi:MAG: 2,4-dihydroxyhept-2-ene-1,7-dioic acid aldolase [Firmicutes bacterium]|nr:2,4-dihydroxyhept-2-ene-1,7-dioic acid aldolase [Bacillota bacterium]